MCPQCCLRTARHRPLRGTQPASAESIHTFILIRLTPTKPSLGDERPQPTGCTNEINRQNNQSIPSRRGTNTDPAAACRCRARFYQPPTAQLTPDSRREMTINAGPVRLAASMLGDKHPTINPSADEAGRRDAVSGYVSRGGRQAKTNIVGVAEVTLFL